MFIAIEGPDAAGKTTTARLLAEYLQAVYYATPPKAFMAQREAVDLHADADAHYRFYLNGLRQASTEIWELLSEGKSVIGDRYWATTYIYHQVMGAAVSQEDFEGIVLPDATVLLFVSLEVQANRFAQRGMSAGDRRMIGQQGIIAQEFRKLLAIEEKNLVAIDTSHLTSSEVMTQALAEVRAF